MFFRVRVGHTGEYAQGTLFVFVPRKWRSSEFFLLFLVLQILSTMKLEEKQRVIVLLRSPVLRQWELVCSFSFVPYIIFPIVLMRGAFFVPYVETCLFYPGLRKFRVV